MNIILGAIVPDTSVDFEWYQNIMGKEATVQEFKEWKVKINQMIKDIKQSGIPSMSWTEIKNAMGAP